jgi:quinolinate synthase
MTIDELQREVVRLKADRGALVLAHAYQSQDILEVADVAGDSYALAVAASRATQGVVVMCGVRFMAETCKVLSPAKRVLLPNPLAGCPMADQLDVDELEALKRLYPGYATVAYVNTSSALKAHADVCVTSSCAVDVCRALPVERILFVPDANLGHYVAGRIPEKEFAFFDGGCPHHRRMGPLDVDAARRAHPDALLLVHPECPPSVVSRADYVGSTTGIMAYARASDAREFVIGTENSIVEHLQFECPDKAFFPLGVSLSCQDMRVTTLVDLHRCLVGTGGEQIELADDVIEGAGRCIRRMIELGG